MNRVVLFLLCLLIAVFFFSCTNKNNENKQTAPFTATDTTAVGKAIVAMTEKITANPAEASLLHERAKLYIQQKNYQYAMDDVNKAISIDSTKASYYITLSDLYFAANKTFYAKSALEKSLAINPDDVEAQLKLAEIYFIVRKYTEAASHLDAVFKKEPLNTKASFMKGMIYKETGDTAKAVATFQTVIDNDQSNYDAYMQIGILYSIKNNPLAVDYYKGALRVKPRSEEALYGRAMFLQDHNEIDKAIQDYTSIIQLNPKNKNAHFNLGYIHYAYLKVYDQAIKHYTDAITADPEYTEAYYNRGLCYEALGNIAAAKADYQKAIDQRPGYELAMKGLERVK